MRDIIKEEIKNSLQAQNPAPAPAPQPSGSQVRVSSPEVEVVSPGRENYDSDSPPSEESDTEVNQGEVDLLLKAVRATMCLEEPREERTLEDKMFEGLEAKRKRTFPVHKSIKGLIQREWKHPDKGMFSARTLKRKYPFEEQDSASWVRAPKIDVPVAKMSRKTALPFEDSGSLPDPIDRKQDSLLKKTWEVTTASLRPDIAGTCVARSLFVWLEQLEGHIRDKTPRETLLSSLPTLKSAANFLAEASADSLKLSAKAAALSNSARRALWIKNWQGDTASKNKLCSIPCDGEFLFGPVLDDLLQKAGDKKKGFPTPFPSRQRPFRGQGRKTFDRSRRQDSQRGKSNRKSRGFLFNQGRPGPQ